MNVKIMYGIVAALFFITMPVFAQDQQQGDEHQAPSADQIVSMMQSKLSLTQDQVSAVTPIVEKYTSKREAMRQSIEDGTADRDSIRTQMKQLKEDEGQELSQVLSADQVNQWKQMMGRGGKHKHPSESGEGSGSNGQ